VGARRNTPKRITKMPPILVSKKRYSSSAAPPKPNRLPKTMNTELKPTIYRTPFTKILRLALALVSGFLSSSAEAPLIKLKYPGTRGRVQGAKNVRMPATNAGITKAEASMMLLYAE